MSAFGAPERVIAALQSGDFDGRRVVLVGDVTMRPAFISLECLAGDALINWLVPHRDNVEAMSEIRVFDERIT